MSSDSPPPRSTEAADLPCPAEGMAYRCPAKAPRIMSFIDSGSLSITGYTPEELMTRTVAYESLVSPEDLATLQRAFSATLLTGETFRIQYRIRDKQGNLRWVYDKGTGTFDPKTGELTGISGLIQELSIGSKHAPKTAETTSHKGSLIQEPLPTFETSDIGQFEITPEGVYLRANESLARLYGFSSAKALLAYLNVSPKHRYVDHVAAETVLSQLKKQRPCSIEVCVRGHDRKSLWLQETLFPTNHPSSGFTYLGTVTDCTEVKQQDALKIHKNQYDAFTGLLNREGLRAYLSNVLMNTEANDVCLLHLGFDRLKSTQSALETAGGDPLLRQLIERLIQRSHPGDILARIESNQFAIVSRSKRFWKEDTFDLSVPQLLLDQLVAPESAENTPPTTIACCMGVALFPLHGQDADSLMHSADIALEEARRKGGSSELCFFSHELAAESLRRLNLTHRLHQAVNQREFVLYFQPKVSVKDGTWLGAEALIRWRGKTGPPVSPAEFIPAAEESGLIVPIGEWVLRQACESGILIARKTGRSMPIAVNVSPRQFRSGSLLSSVRKALSETGLPPQALELEITESSMIEDPSQITNMLNQLKQLGVTLAIDDFGTGYSNMIYLKSLPVDRLKIGQSFIAGIGDDPIDREILRAIVALGHGLNLKVVAEGIETVRQHAVIQEIGCDEAQGYLFGQPEPLEAFLSKLTDSE